LSSRISDRKDHKKGEVPPSPKRRIMWIESARKIVLFVSFILFNLGVLGVSPIPLPLPILEGGSSSIKTVGYSFDLIQTLFAKVIFPWLPFASIFLLSVIVGRATCGWLCPFGFVQDLLAYIKRKHSEVDLRIHNQMIKLKYLILAVTLFVSDTCNPIYNSFFSRWPFTNRWSYGSLNEWVRNLLGANYSDGAHSTLRRLYSKKLVYVPLPSRRFDGCLQPFQLPRFKERSAKVH